MKKLFALIATICISLCSFAAATAFSSAKAETTARYFLLENISAIAATEEYIAVADDRALYLFSQSGEQIKNYDLGGKTATSLAFDGAGGTLYAAMGGEVYKSDTSAWTFSEKLSNAPAKAKFVAEYNGNLYVYETSERKIKECSTSDGEEITPHNVGGITGLTAGADGIYYSTVSGGFATVYNLSGAVAADGLRSGGTISACGDKLYAILAGGEVAEVTADGAVPLPESAGATAIAATAGGVYYSTDIGEVRLTGGGGDSLVIASANDEDGFYARPSDVAARLGMLAVADTYNDRVTVMLKDGGKHTIALTHPRAVAIFNSGRIAAAHSQTKVSVFTASGERISERDYDYHATVTDFAVDADDNLYAVAGGKLYKGDETEPITEPEKVITAVSAFGGKVYAAAGNKIYTVTESGSNEEFSLDGEKTILSIANDEAGNFFIAAIESGTTKILKYTAEGAESSTVTVNDENLKNSKQVSLCVARATAGGFNYGDLVICDGSSSRVFPVAGTEAGTDMREGETAAPDTFDNDKIIRPAKEQCRIYAAPNEREIKAVIPAGEPVIVAKYDIANRPAYSYVFFEDSTGQTYYTGYVFRSALGDYLPYVDPPAEKGVVFSTSATMYALPSVHAETVTTLNRDDIVDLLPFADYERAGRRWYHVRTEDGKEGYVSTSELSVRGYDPGGTRPQYNAEIKAYNDSPYAQVYTLQGGEYTAEEGSVLQAGTRVEVVGRFDSSQKFTRIRYYDEKLGTRECFVETVYIDYNGISVVKIVAIIVGSLTLILLILLLLRLYMRRRKI